LESIKVGNQMVDAKDPIRVCWKIYSQNL